MSKYTTQVRFIVESFTPNMEGMPIQVRCENAAPSIFSFPFPIWDEGYKTTLEKKILMHYYMNEIGAETVALWQLFMNEKLNLIMPYYVDLYETTQKQYDYLNDTNIVETITRKLTNTENGTFTGNGKTTSQNTSTGNNTLNSLRSDLPQANYAGVDYGTNLQEDSTDSTVNDNGTSTVEQDSTNQNTKDIEETVSNTRIGVNHAPSITKLITEYRDALLNIDRMIITDLSDLFMLIY